MIFFLLESETLKKKKINLNISKECGWNFLSEVLKHKVILLQGDITDEFRTPRWWQKSLEMRGTAVFAECSSCPLTPGSRKNRCFSAWQRTDAFLCMFPEQPPSDKPHKVKKKYQMPCEISEWRKNFLPWVLGVKTENKGKPLISYVHRGSVI